MKIINVLNSEEHGGERIVGADATGSHACYLIHGIINPANGPRMFRPGKGHEEIILALKGDLVLAGAFNGVLKAGQAIHLRNEETCTAENRSENEAVYVIAGGHAESGHHHH